MKVLLLELLGEKLLQKCELAGTAVLEGKVLKLSLYVI